MSPAAQIRSEIGADSLRREADRNAVNDNGNAARFPGKRDESGRTQSVRTWSPNSMNRNFQSSHAFNEYNLAPADRRRIQMKYPSFAGCACFRRLAQGRMK
jgi:hypothetical protein